MCYSDTLFLLSQTSVQIVADTPTRNETPLALPHRDVGRVARNLGLWLSLLAEVICSVSLIQVLREETYTSLNSKFFVIS